MKFLLPDPSLVILIGASGSGKSTFVRNQFKTTEIISSDVCQGLVSDDACGILHDIAAKRLASGQLIDNSEGARHAPLQ